ncbi:extracellular solute-binding protein [Paenibacillus sp. TRM 82003]|nr:extracellular solute-binding protein [Paenibacillus sp. TRM 82003]
MIRWKMVAAGVMALSVFFVTACGSDGGAEAPQSTPAGTDGASEAAQAPAEISVMLPLHYAETPSGKVEELIEEKLNVKLEIQWIPATTFQDRMNAAMATGSLTDIVNIPLAGVNREAIRDGQFWEIGPYLEEYENLSKLNPDILRNTMVDGKLYALYQGRPLSRQGLIYRKDWADKLGLSAPTTIDELNEMLKQFTENDPDGNGKNDTIGLADRNDLNSGAFKTLASWYGGPNEWGEQDGKLLPKFMSPEYKQTMTFMKQLRDNGYMNADFPVTSKTDQQNLMKNGTAGAYIGCMCDVQTISTDGVQLNPDAIFDVHNQVKGPSGEFTVWSIPGYNHPYLFPKSAVESEEELKQVLAFFDGLMSPELANLVYWGVEGEHYTVQDGRAVPVDDQAKLESEVKPFQTIEVGEPATNGRYEAAFKNEAAAKAEALFKDNNDYLVFDPTVTLDSETFTQHKDRLDQIVTDATYKFMLGEIDDAGFDKEIERWKSEGGDKIIEEFNASYQAAQ